MDTSTLAREMLTERTAHSIIDSGGIYGRRYEKNKEVDFENTPQAVLTEWGASVSFYHHMAALLEQNPVTEAFNSLPSDDWHGDHYGCSRVMSDFLQLIGAEIGDAWNTYNWENNFDQTVQGCDVEINQERYVLIQIHGGCDVRSGYTDAKLFKLDDWDADYWLDDSCSFYVPRSALGMDGEDEVCLDFQSGVYQPEVYDPEIREDLDFEVDFNKFPKGLKIEGVQRAVEH